MTDFRKIKILDFWPQITQAQELCRFKPNARENGFKFPSNLDMAHTYLLTNISTCAASPPPPSPPKFSKILITILHVSCLGSNGRSRCQEFIYDVEDIPSMGGGWVELVEGGLVG